jgi:23S rRNA (uracil1939-C5)-methyltransferase
MTETLTISRLGHRGDGVAELPGGPVFVAGALPGERITAQRLKPGSEGERAELVEVLEPSTDRAAPFCPLFGRCGGCATQHMAEQPYRDWKRGLLVEVLARAALVPPVAGMIDAHGEGRRRVTFHARREGAGWLLGFMAARSHEIVDLEHCPILVPGLAKAPAIARRLAQQLGGSKPLDIQVTATQGGLDVDIRGHGPLNDKGRLAAMITLAGVLDLARLSLHGETMVERRSPSLTMGKAQIAPPPGGFLQATAAGEATLAELVTALVPKKAKRIADLFCGCGPIALHLASMVQVHAADSEKAAMTALDRAWRGASGLKTITMETRDLFRRPLLESELNTFDMVVLDPPRAGALAQVERLAASKVSLIAYVSCNAASFARDAALLVAAGYALESVTPVDQFRHSAHVELVGAFRRSAGKP